jgi:2-methylisocitrate lyase-like PEP mutase family enzyme
LVLVNVWDAASAREVEAAGAAALATSSAAIAAMLGEPDNNSMAPDLVFEAVRRIAAGAEVPVTADLEAGYGLEASELVERLLAAGGSGCNLEDSDHSRPGQLVEAEANAERLSAVRAAAGGDVVLNARIDTLLYGGDLDEVIRRARLYVEAGADCVYPIRLTEPDDVRKVVEAVGAPVNANLGPSTTVADVAAAGASRVSIGPMAYRLGLADLGRRAKGLLTMGGLGE